MAKGHRSAAARQRAQEVALKQWRRKLLADRPGALKIVRMVMERLAAQNIYHQTDLARFYSQMINGVATPGEFGVNDEEGVLKRA